MAKMIWRPPNPENANDGQGVVEVQGNGATDAAGRDDKLEIRTDEGWFAAELTLREDGITNVHFDYFSVEEDEQWDAEKIKSLNPINNHIRVVSVQLQDEECGILNVNKIVCALRTAGDKEGWYDAVVLEMRKRQHTFGDQGETCTCSFTVKWRDGPAKGLTERNLTCAQICLLSTKNVETHPLVVDMLRCASGEWRGMDQEKERPSSSASRVRRRKGNTDDDTDFSGELVYIRRRLKRLKPKDTDASQAKDPLKQSVLVVDDHSAGTPSVHREVRDVPSLSSRSTELSGDNSLSSHSAKLIREITAEIFAGVNHLKQSKQPLVATQDVPPLSSPAAADSSRPMKRMNVDHLKQSKRTSKRTVEATQDVAPLSSPSAAADSNRAMTRMSVDHLKQSKQTTQDSLPPSSPAAADGKRAEKRMCIDYSKQSNQTVEATRDLLPLSSPAAADGNRPMKRMTVDRLKQSNDAVETTQCVPPLSYPSDADSKERNQRMRVEQLQQSKQALEARQDMLPLSSPAAADSNRPMKRMSVDHLKQSKHAGKTTRYVPPLSYPAAAAADCNELKKRMRVQQLQLSKQGVETTQDGPPFSSSAPDDTSRTKRKMRGQVESEDPFPSNLSEQRERIFGTKSSERVCKAKEQPKKVSMEPLDSAYDSQVQQMPTISPQAKPVEDLRIKAKDCIDLTEEGNFELPVMKGTVKSKADSLEERQLSRPMQVQAKKEDVEAKTDFLQERRSGRRSSEVQVKEDVKDESGGNDGFPKLPSDVDIKETEVKTDPILKQKRAGSLAATDENTKVGSEVCETQKKIATFASKSDGQRSKKVRITVEFDMELDESASIVEGLSLTRSCPAGAKVTSESPNFEDPRDSDGKSETMATTRKPSECKPEVHLSCPADCPPPTLKDEKFIHASVIRGRDNGREEELPGSIYDSFEGQKINDPSVEPNVESESKFVMHRKSTARADNQQDQVDSKFCLRVGSNLENAICLSDEEEDGVTAGSTIPPASSSMAFSSNSSLAGYGPAFTDEQQECWNVHLRNNRAKNMSSFIKNVLARSGCILVIDNLELDVRESDVRELCLKFFTKEKIQSVTIPPPRRELNRAIGYVTFGDKEAADRAAGIFASLVIVSARGRPWVVRTQGQEEPDNGKADLMDDVLDGNALSSQNFKVLTKRQCAEYKAARNRQRVFCEHLKQTRVMFQSLAQEEAKLDLVLYR